MDSSLPTRSKYTVLCVDDDALTTVAMQKRLEAEFEQVYTANNGIEGLEQFKQYHPDIVITDINMPQMDGIQMVTAIKEIHPDVKVIYITAFSQADTLIKAISAGADGYIVKPFSDYQYNNAINTVLLNLDKEKAVKDHHKLIETILNEQDNLLMVYDKEQVSFCNKAFLTFFDIEDIATFNARHECVSQMFFEKEGFFSPSILNEGEHWIKHMSKESVDKRIVLMLRRPDLEPRAFAIKVSSLNPFESKKLVAFTDITEITIQSKQHEYHANYDSLTKIYNRNKFNEHLKMKIDMGKRYKLPLSIIMFDIDHFKLVNDTFGHLTGDEVLIKIASLVSDHIRNTDIFARWGGEEFAIIAPITTANEASLLGEKLRSLIEKTNFNDAGNLTCSFGITEYQEKDSENTLLKRVDEALYEAKNSGRNIVIQKSYEDSL